MGEMKDRWLYMEEVCMYLFVSKCMINNRIYKWNTCALSGLFVYVKESGSG